MTNIYNEDNRIVTLLKMDNHLIIMFLSTFFHVYLNLQHFKIEKNKTFV